LTCENANVPPRRSPEVTASISSHPARTPGPINAPRNRKLGLRKASTKTFGGTCP